MMRFEGDGSDQDQRTVWCGNISDQVSDEILYELFLQAGPLESVKRPRDPSGCPKAFAFIVYKHECSVPYAVELFRGEKLYNKALNVSTRSMLQHIPVLDTHLTEFTENLWEQPRDWKEDRDQRNDRRHLERDHRNENSRRDWKKNDNEPKSWAELNALRGKGSLLVKGLATALLNGPMHHKESKAPPNNVPDLPDFEKLLQMGSQMMPNMMGPGMFSGIPNMPFPPMVSGPVGPNMYPSMQGGMNGGNRFSPEKERKRNDCHERRGSRSYHPYEDKCQGSRDNNRRHSDNRFDHRRHERGYSSSRSSHERERRDRRSR